MSVENLEALLIKRKIFSQVHVGYELWIQEYKEL